VQDGLLESSKDTRMNDRGESRKEAADRKMEVLSAKCKTGIGFWNVKAMHETGKLSRPWKIATLSWSTGLSAFGAFDRAMPAGASSPGRAT